MQIFLLFAILVAAVAVIFALQNTGLISVSFLFWSFTGSLALVVLLTVSLGALISFLASLPAIIRRDLTIRSQKKRVNELETNLADTKIRMDAIQKQLENRAPSNQSASTPAELTSNDEIETGKKLWQTDGN